MPRTGSIDQSTLEWINPGMRTSKVRDWTLELESLLRFTLQPATWVHLECGLHIAAFFSGTRGG
eukprot:5112459-Prymnesium_polylepis.1